MYLVIGTSGRYICFDDFDESGYLIDEGIHGALLEALKPVLCIGLYFKFLDSSVQSFIGWSCGSVLQAFSSSIDQLLQVCMSFLILNLEFSSSSCCFGKKVLFRCPWIATVAIPFAAI